MNGQGPPPHLNDITQLLQRFFASRSDRPRHQLEAEYGDLLLYFMRLANRSGVDLIDLGQRYIESTARNEPSSSQPKNR